MISFGTDFVAGKNRVPIPATGKIAFVTLRVMSQLLLQISYAAQPAPVPAFTGQAMLPLGRHALPHLSVKF
jgi:hypothetical protein